MRYHSLTGDNTNNTVPLYRKGIAWYTDEHVKFRNPPTNNSWNLAQAFEGEERPTSSSWTPGRAHVFWGWLSGQNDPSSPPSPPTGTTSPPYWQKPVYELDALDANNNGFINEDLIVWMREAAFPNFKKLYGVLARGQAPFTSGLPAGTYSVDIGYSIRPAARLYSNKVEMEGRNVIYR